MAAAKEIRGKIKSVENTKKITKAMEMVAASKMRKAQDRMFAARPYSDTVRVLATHLAAATPEYVHPYMVTPTEENRAKRVGVFVVSTDKGLCGGLNTNVFRILTNKFREFEEAGNEIDNVVVGQKGHAFLNRIGAKVVAQVTQIGDVPRLERLIGPAYTLLNAYMEGKMDAIYLCYTKFINTMKQEAVIEQLLPLTEEKMSTEGLQVTAGHSWEYIYEPEPKPVIDELLERYIEALIFQSVAENIASEQSARMVAMKSASDNAGSVISELKLVYNKTRQAAITKELSEIVGGAAAV